MSKSKALVTFDWAGLAESDREKLTRITEGFMAAEKAGHKAAVAMGDFLEEAAASMPGVYTQWVTTVLGWSVDKAANLRNYAKKFRDVDETIAGRFHGGAASKLAAPGVDDEARQWAFTHAGELPPGESFDLELAQIARDPYVRGRYDEGTLTKGQGAQLAVALVQLEDHPALYNFLVELKVSYAEVARYIVQAYMDKSTRTTWTDLQGDQWCFRWVAKNNGRERIVAVTDMTPAELEDGYKAYRQWQAIEAKKAAEAAARAEQFIEYDIVASDGEYKRTGQKLSINLPANIPKDAQLSVSIHVTYQRKPLEE